MVHVRHQSLQNVPVHPAEDDHSAVDVAVAAVEQQPGEERAAGGEDEAVAADAAAAAAVTDECDVGERVAAAAPLPEGRGQVRVEASPPNAEGRGGDLGVVVRHRRDACLKVRRVFQRAQFRCERRDAVGDVREGQEGDRLPLSGHALQGFDALRWLSHVCHP